MENELNTFSKKNQYNVIIGKPRQSGKSYNMNQLYIDQLEYLMKMHLIKNKLDVLIKNC